MPWRLFFVLFAFQSASDWKPDLKLVRFPTRSSLTLATLPSTSLIPIAPFTVWLKASS